jgi:hypothetical protein
VLKKNRLFEGLIVVLFLYETVKSLKTAEDEEKIFRILVIDC